MSVPVTKIPRNTEHLLTMRGRERCDTNRSIISSGQIDVDRDAQPRGAGGTLGGRMARTSKPSACIASATATRGIVVADEHRHDVRCARRNGDTGRQQPRAQRSRARAQGRTPLRLRLDDDRGLHRARHASAGGGAVEKMNGRARWMR